MGRKAEAPRFLPQERELVVEHVARIARRAGARADRRHARAVQLVLRRDRHERDDPLRRHRLGPDDRLEEDLRELVREVLLFEELEERRIAVDGALVEIAPDGDAAFARDLPDVFDDPIESALAAAQRPHAVVRVAIAVERDLDAVQPERQHPVDDLMREEQAVGDDVDVHRHLTSLSRFPHPLRDFVHDGQVQQRLAAEEREHELSGTDAIELARHPRDRAPRGVERHPVGALVVVAVVALEAVIAGEVALKRGEQCDVQLGGIALHLGEVLVEVPAIGRMTLNEESVLPQKVDGFLFLGVEGVERGLTHTIEERRHIR